MEKKTTMEYVNEFATLAELNEFMDDETITTLIAKVVKMIGDQSIPPHVAVQLMIELEAHAAKFALEATYFAHVKKGQENRDRKNVYFTAKEVTQRLVDTLKYAARLGN